MTLFNLYHVLAAQLIDREDFPLPLPKWNRDYPHNIGLLSDAEESELAAIVHQLTRGMSYESWKTLDMGQRIPWMQQAVKQFAESQVPRRMKKDEVLAGLVTRVQKGTPIVTANELAGWPTGLIDEFLSTGTLQATDNALSVVCDACGQDHMEQVQYIQSPPGSALRAYISCPDCGRVQVPLHRLRQWVVNRSRLPDESESDAFLSQRAQLVLAAMYEMALFDSDQRRATEDIAVKALGPDADANSLKSVMIELKSLQMIETKTGRGGGCWLTKKGRTRAEKLRNG
ncbi:MAG: hypothetical protein WEB58_12805 [Planctomycetaceae bacterium]